MSVVNLSNHPSASWSAAQLEAAHGLGHGAVREPPSRMPVVDPASETEAVVALAQAVADEAVAYGARGAFVASDFVFTFALVRALQRCGVRCYAATTAREVVETRLADGGSEKRSVFRFVRWRAYPE